jgi:hypothetical protein
MIPPVVSLSSKMPFRIAVTRFFVAGVDGNRKQLFIC